METESAERSWSLFGSKVPKSEIVFFCQVIVIYTVIVVSIYNLTVGGGNSNLWTSLLSSSIGYSLPNPTIKFKKKIRPDPTSS